MISKEELEKYLESEEKVWYTSSNVSYTKNFAISPNIRPVKVVITKTLSSGRFQCCEEKKNSLLIGESENFFESYEAAVDDYNQTIEKQLERVDQFLEQTMHKINTRKNSLSKLKIKI